ncbi:hypothetical protein HMPREF0208_00711 [Citrobacter koseri]|nr:hypothetical protein HMPREF3220_02358 [Citrobacter koseri]KXA06649.1 hypothetical protein HMPREF3207_00033 [Citrobacter koseri]KXB46437.1 hypothetical protein HMPREF0208_00711 [Citrobacter koseri]
MALAKLNANEANNRQCVHFQREEDDRKMTAGREIIDDRHQE